MKKMNIMHRVSVVALACTLAVPSIAIAQEADPAASPVVDAPAPVAVDPVEPAVEPSVTADQPAEQVTTPVVATTTATTKPKVKVARAANPNASTASASSSAAPVASPAPSAVNIAPTTLPAPSESAVEQAAAAQAMPTAEDSAMPTSDEAVFGGALALLIIGAGALGMARRRKAIVEEPEEVPMMTPAANVRREIDISPAPVIPATDRSAFSWGAPIRQTAMSPVERAERGPSPDNPSLSLKKRLKRSHFFAQRERDAANGIATPVSRYAGLPARLVETARETVAAPRREFQPA